MALSAIIYFIPDGLLPVVPCSYAPGCDGLVQLTRLKSTGKTTGALGLRDALQQSAREPVEEARQYSAVRV